MNGNPPLHSSDQCADAPSMARHSVSAQMGKPRIIISEDELVRRVQDWNIGRDRRDNYQDYEDDTLVAMVELHRIVVCS